MLSWAGKMSNNTPTPCTGVGHAIITNETDGRGNVPRCSRSVLSSLRCSLIAVRELWESEAAATHYASCCTFKCGEHFCLCLRFCHSRKQHTWQVNSRHSRGTVRAITLPHVLIPAWFCLPHIHLKRLTFWQKVFDSSLTEVMHQRYSAIFTHSFSLYSNVVWNHLNCWVNLICICLQVP